MTTSQAFNKALDEGKLIVRAMWYNDNAPKNKVTIQFAGRTNRADIDEDFFTSDSPATNPLVLIASGLNTTGTFSYTVLASWNLEQLRKRFEMTDAFVATLKKSTKDSPVYFMEKNAVITAKQLYGQDVTVTIERTTVANTRTVKPQAPVQSPDGSRTLTFEKKSLYNHTWLIPGNTPAFIFSGHTTVNPSLQAPVATAQKAPSKAEAFVEEVASLEDMGF